jgi:integrase
VFTALALFTGARRTSILTLTWDRVDLDRGIVNFQEPGRTLTKKRRAVVPMTTQLRAVLAAAKQDRIPECDYVVAWQGKPVPFGLRWSFAKLCVAAGLTWKPTPHHMKHSVASFMAMDRVPIDQAADWLATDPATLRRTYRHFDPTYLRSVASSLDL